MQQDYSMCCEKKRWLGEEMHGVWSRGFKTNRKTKEGVKEDCQVRKLNTENAMDCSKWMSDDQDECECVSVSSGTGPPG